MGNNGQYFVYFENYKRFRWVVGDVLPEKDNQYLFDKCYQNSCALQVT